MAEAEYIAMTRQAQDSLIAIAVLWVICAAVVGFRLMGRVQGAGIGPDDVLSCVALVRLYSTTMLTKTMEVDR
jgi:hypothetical protein